jgi:hypothetical protein
MNRRYKQQGMNEKSANLSGSSQERGRFADFRY